jgi:hypothetical protein
MTFSPHGHGHLNHKPRHSYTIVSPRWARFASIRHTHRVSRIAIYSSALITALIAVILWTVFARVRKQGDKWGALSFTTGVISTVAAIVQVAVAAFPAVSATRAGSGSASVSGTASPSAAASSIAKPSVCGRPGQSLDHVFTASVSGECIGYSDNAAQDFGTGENLKAAEHLVFAKNREVDSLKHAKWTTPVVRLILLTGLTTAVSQTGDEQFPAEKEALQALAVLQAEAIDDAKDDHSITKPLLQVVIANAGEQAGGIGTLMPAVQRLAKNDHTVLGALVAMDSQTTTKAAMKSLDDLGLLVLTATAAADGMGGGLHHYLQLQTPNKVQARLVHDYATRMLGRRKIVDFTTYGERQLLPGNNDLYVDTMRDDLKNAFSKANFTTFNWKQSIDLTPWCNDNFPDGVVYFGGRYKNFGPFLTALYNKCHGKGNLPVLMAAGNAHRHLIGADSRDGWPTDFPLIVDANGVASSSCTAARDNNAQKTFINRVHTVLGLCGSAHEPQPIGMRVGLTYDLVAVVRNAIGDLVADGKSQPSGTDVYRRIFVNNKTGFTGVSGRFRFGPDGVVENGVDSLLCVPSIHDAYHNDTPREIARTSAVSDNSILLETCPPH